jgi:Flp pilus assembly protein TadG
MPGPRRTERGAAVIELVILAPLLLGMIWLTIQFALWYQGRQVALAAAQLGARVASQDAVRVPDWEARAERSAQYYYRGLGTKVLGGQIGARAEPAGVGQIRVTVTGTAVSLVPGLTLTIHETAGGPIDCFRPDLNGGQACAG